MQVNDKLAYQRSEQIRLTMQQLRQACHQWQLTATTNHPTGQYQQTLTVNGQ